jgi:hypothetical protein
VERAVLDDCVAGVAAAADDGAFAETVVDPDPRGAVDAGVLAAMGGIDEMLLICIGFPSLLGQTFLKSFVGGFG